MRHAHLQALLDQQGTPGSRATLSPTFKRFTPAPTCTTVLRSALGVSLVQGRTPKAGSHCRLARPARRLLTAGALRMHGCAAAGWGVHPEDSWPMTMGPSTTKSAMRPFFQ